MMGAGCGWRALTNFFERPCRGPSWIGLVKSGPITPRVEFGRVIACWGLNEISWMGDGSINSDGYE